MAVTTTPRFGLVQWGAGSDSPNRVAFNNALAAIDAGAAKDYGAQGGTSLPNTGLVDGLYAQTMNAGLRRLYRRAGGAWQQVGGNAWGETFYNVADAGAATDALSRQTSHPSLGNPGAREFWDGSSVRGGRQAIGDVNAAQPGALHVGDTAAAVDLAARGRVYVRTTANGHRAVVASAHADTAGPLFTAREAGGSDPWFVDARGRMRAQAPASFGAADLTAGVPLVSAPGAADITAADLYAAASKQALRILRAIGDADPIAGFGQDRITLGRASWAGGRIDLTSPDNRVTGPLSVSGPTSLAGLSAGAASVSSLTAQGTVQASTVTAVGGVNAENGRVYSQSQGSGATVLSRPPAQYAGSSPASLRQPMVTQSSRNPELPINAGAGSTYDTTIVMAEDGWLKLDSVVGIRIDTGASNAFEMGKCQYWFDLRNASGTIETSYAHTASVISDDTSRQIQGHTDFASSDVFWTRLAAGTYTLRLRITRTTVLGGYVAHVRYHVTPCVLHSIDV